WPLGLLHDGRQLVGVGRASHHAVEGVVLGRVDLVAGAVADVELVATVEHAVCDLRQLRVAVREDASRGLAVRRVGDLGDRYAVDGAADVPASAVPVEDAVLADDVRLTGAGE